MKTLLLTDTEEGFELLGENAGWYGDNGGDPDGNAWLPKPSHDLSDTQMQQVANAGYGRIVEVVEATDEQVAALLGVVLPDQDTEEWEDGIEALKDKANSQLQWAHYGAYGAMDSQWVYIQ